MKSNKVSTSVKGGSKGPVQKNQPTNVDDGNNSTHSLRKNPVRKVLFDDGSGDDDNLFSKSVGVGDKSKAGKKEVNSTASHTLNLSKNTISTTGSTTDSGNKTSNAAQLTHVDNSVMFKKGNYSNGSTSSSGFIFTQEHFHDEYYHKDDAVPADGGDEEDGEEGEKEDEAAVENDAFQSVPAGGRKYGAKSYSAEENKSIIVRVYRGSMFSSPCSDHCWKSLAEMLGNCRKPSVYYKHVTEMLTDMRSVIMMLSRDSKIDMPFSTDTTKWTENLHDRDSTDKEEIRLYAEECLKKLKENRPKWWNLVSVVYTLFIVAAQSVEVPPEQDAHGVSIMRDDRKRKFQAEQDARAALVKETRRKEEERALRRDEEHEVLIQSVQADADATKAIATAAATNAAAMMSMQKTFEMCAARMNSAPVVNQPEVSQLHLRLDGLQNKVDSMERDLDKVIGYQKEILQILRSSIK